MSEEAVAKSVGAVTEPDRQRVLALAAGTDNVGLFFGEDRCRPGILLCRV